MAKAKSTGFFCKECGYESAKWLGQCPGCHQWNTFVEEPVVKALTSSKGKRQEYPVPGRLSDVSCEEAPRFSTGMEELNRVLGGGLVPGSLILVGGDPGIGKSTLLLQVCNFLSDHDRRVLYISGEESARQIKMRADRMGNIRGNLFLLPETNLELVEHAIRDMRPEVVVIDSIQTMYREDIGSAPGSVSQVRESTNTLMQLAKSESITIFLVGHVTKEGVVAGPRVLEHMVDTVLYFEGERSSVYRILRAVKNRFGATNEIGVFEMGERGLEEVANPSAYLLSGRPLDASGSVVACMMEGSRPVMLEIQALVSKTNFGMPRRTTIGMDFNRVNLLMAVIEKKLGGSLSEYDAYVNVTGGLRITEPAVDLAVVMALCSSYRDRIIDSSTVIFGEVGLTGEVRGVSMVQQRIHEASKMGFTRAVLPKASMKGVKIPEGFSCLEVETIRDAWRVWQ